MGHAVAPAEPGIRDAELRARLILEEAREVAVGLVGAKRAKEILIEESYQTGFDGPALVEAVDGLCDLIYVAYGCAESIGVDLDEYFDVVHEANMAKMATQITTYGKVGEKPPGWVKPNGRIAEMLIRARDRARREDR
jgi:predicted HAD superfamily Cof-like phosphohydrolase